VTREDDVRAVIDGGVADGTTPGAAAVVMGPGRRLVHVAGALHRGPNAASVTTETVFDLASLTKLLSTTVLAARAVDEKKLSLDETPWPRWPGVTIEHVLRHESGLPAWRPLFEEARRRNAVGLAEGKRGVVEAALAAPLEAEPGSRTLYSDLGFIALGALLEDRFGKPLDELKHGFVRLERDGFHPAVPLVAPTERCPWRRRAMHGQVHDENCFAMGGVAGHAGLFGSLADVEGAGRALLDELRGTGTIAKFAVVPEGARRPVGFDRTTPGGTTGDALSKKAVGHLAFTGCSLWLDPSDDAVYVLLTNRIHESREHPERIANLRRNFHRAAASWLRAD
jgi:CubicO group peptidase (beta-lactamase class C family)